MRAETHPKSRAPLRLAALAAAAFLCTPPARAAHPLITEDAYTLGEGVAQIEIGYEHARFDQADLHGRANEVRLVLSYGVRDNLDVLLGAPYLNTRELSADDIARARGVADTALELKWRFYDGDLAKVAVKPGLTIPTGNFREGLGGGRVVPSLFVVSTVERNAWIWNLHLGYVRNENRIDERTDLLHLSGSVVYRAGPRVQWALDLSADSNPDRHSGTLPAVALAAVIYSPTDDLDVDVGIKLGLNGAADDYGVLTGLTYRW